MEKKTIETELLDLVSDLAATVAELGLAIEADLRQALTAGPGAEQPDPEGPERRGCVLSTEQIGIGQHWENRPL